MGRGLGLGIGIHLGVSSPLLLSLGFRLGWEWGGVEVGKGMIMMLLTL